MTDAEASEDAHLRRLAPSRSPQLLRNQFVELGAVANGYIASQVTAADQHGMDVDSWRRVIISGFVLGSDVSGSPPVLVCLGIDLIGPLAQEDKATDDWLSGPAGPLFRLEMELRLAPGSHHGRERATGMLRQILRCERPARHHELVSLLCWVIEGGPNEWPLWDARSSTPWFSVTA